MHARTFTVFYLLHERIWLDEAVLQALAETANPGYHRLEAICGDHL
jgi:uncharacterized membrane protein